MPGVHLIDRSGRSDDEVAAEIVAALDEEFHDPTRRGRGTTHPG
jgi:hypothetical protein